MWLKAFLYNLIELRDFTIRDIYKRKFDNGNRTCGIRSKKDLYKREIIHLQLKCCYTKYNDRIYSTLIFEGRNSTLLFY